LSTAKRLSDTNTIDYLGMAKGEERVLMTLLDDFDGDDEHERLKLLSAKLNRYCDCIESQEVYYQATGVAGRLIGHPTPVSISVLAKRPFVGDDGNRFIDHVRNDLAKDGIGFSFKVL
jgi:hypothetical protein